jgi:hypothetical protein
VPVADLGLVLAVALGTAPTVLGEGQRSGMVVRLRRTGPDGPTGGSAPARMWQRATDRVLLVVPMMETLGRRAEALTLSLRRRRPRPAVLGRLPLAEGVGLGLWLGVLVWRPW